MSTDTMTATQVYRVYIKATPQAIWDAITQAGVDASATATRTSPTSTCGPAARTRPTPARR